jgi:histidinol dehydrogenase
MVTISRYAIGDPEIVELLDRSAVPDQHVLERTASICRQVQQEGDAAIKSISEKFGGSRRPIRVSADEIAEAVASASPALLSAIEASIENVRTVHQAQLPENQITEPTAGVSIERRWEPLRRVGAYVPGGRAAYPSTLIMTVVPAQVAGVEEIVVVTPTDDGALQPATLAAAGTLGVTELYAIGGAQAVAALAYGTETIPRVQKIVGPGNAYVTAAKLHVLGTCSIDIPAGPSEVLIICDGTENPLHVAADLLCQAEHGPDSPAILVSTDPTFLDQVAAAIDSLLGSLERSDILIQALEGHGAFVTAPSLDAAVAFANDYAPEHITILTQSPEKLVDALTNAGSVYVGQWAPESAGDYASGANHVLPTGGLARSQGPLSTEDFGSWRQIQRITRDGLRQLAPTISTLARAEGLTAHALSAELRLNSNLGVTQ